MRQCVGYERFQRKTRIEAEARFYSQGRKRANTSGTHTKKDVRLISI
jgi:hypothetical protein